MLLELLSHLPLYRIVVISWVAEGGVVEVLIDVTIEGLVRASCSALANTVVVVGGLSAQFEFWNQAIIYEE